jgi:hypothetical protein
MPPELHHSDSEMMRFAVSEAVVESLPRALKEAARDPEMWAAANEGIQEHVSTKAGSWLMKIIWLAISRVLLFIVLGSVVYAVGGWSLVAKIFAGGVK